MPKIINPYYSKCLMCGKEFLNKLGRHKKYCGSQKEKIGCSYVARVNKFRRFREGKYRNKVLETQRRLNNAFNLKIKEKYDFTCQLCGIRNELKGFMDIDHKDGRRENNNKDNLWVLCPNCHRIKTIKS